MFLSPIYELSALPQCSTAQCAASLFDFAAFGQRESTSSGSRAVGKRSSAGESPLVVQVFDCGDSALVFVCLLGPLGQQKMATERAGNAFVFSNTNF